MVCSNSVSFSSGVSSYSRIDPKTGERLSSQRVVFGKRTLSLSHTENKPEIFHNIYK